MRGLKQSSEYGEAEMGRDAWSHGAPSWLQPCRALPAIPKQTCLCTYLPQECMSMQQETRALTPGQTSAEDLPSCNAVSGAVPLGVQGQRQAHHAGSPQQQPWHSRASSLGVYPQPKLLLCFWILAGAGCGAAVFS